MKFNLPPVERRNMGGQSRTINTSSASFIEAELSDSQTGKRPVVVLADVSEATRNSERC